MVALGRSETVESELLAPNQAIVESGGFNRTPTSFLFQCFKVRPVGSVKPRPPYSCELDWCVIKCWYRLDTTNSTQRFDYYRLVGKSLPVNFFGIDYFI